MQPLAVQSESRGQRRICAVGEVADARVADRGHVHPDLMGTPGLEPDVEQARRAERLERLVMGDAVAAAGDDRELVVGSRMAADRRVDGARATDRDGPAPERGSACRPSRSRNASLSREYAISLLATTISPDVPTSSRCTIPCRSAAPLVATRWPAAASPPVTVGPSQPGLGCAATPTGLSTTSRSASS